MFLCERRSDPPGLLLGRLDIGTSLLKGHTLSRHYHSLKGEKQTKKQGKKSDVHGAENKERQQRCLCNYLIVLASTHTAGLY